MRIHVDARLKPKLPVYRREALGLHWITLKNKPPSAAEFIPYMHKLNTEEALAKSRFSSGTITEVFEAQVAASPARTAIVCGQENITYEELNVRSNQLAHYLRNMGVGPESRVALYMDRNIDALMAITGILKAGAAYVPIDPTYPQHRVDFILKDASIEILVAQEKTCQSLSHWQGKILVLEREWPAIAQESSSNPIPLLKPSNAAYVIYTSGSTGVPKGVIVTHHNVVRLFGTTDSFFGFSEDDVWTLFHSFTFDLSVWEMWGAFFYGGKLVVVPYLTSRSPQAFYELLSREQATSLTQTPSAFRQLIWADESAETKLPLNLKYVVLAGEALDLQNLRPWFDRHGDEKPRIINMYGITETTVHVTQRQIRKEDLDARLGSVIGPPMPDLTLHILDEHQKPCPVDVAGEIYVGGPGVARGYLNRPELNAKRFIQNPFSSNPEDRLYRSGDLAKVLSNGEIEFLGRMDDQVKIRGFRVELGEVQSALTRHSGVRASVVIAQTQSDQSTRLAAYYVVRDENLTVDQLRSFLQETLPDYMIPSVFIRLKTIPLTLNGKVDRRSLPSPDRARPELETRYAAPSTDNEKILTEIWKDVLQLDEIGINDNFFALGGDSIRSIRVLAQAEQKGLRLSLGTIFENPTITEAAKCAEVISKASTMGDSSPFALVSSTDMSRLPADAVDAYPMAQLQLGMVAHSGFAPASAVFHDVFSYHAGYPFDNAKFQLAVDRITERHAIFRTAYDLANYSEPLQLIYPRAKTPVSVESAASLSPQEQHQRVVDWIEIEKRSPFDWSSPPFLRFHIQIQSSNSFQLIASFHHSVMDGWSLAVMITELLQEYHALLNGHPIKIEALTTSYRDFVTLEQQAIYSQKARQFWKNRLQDPPAAKLARWPSSLRKGGREQVRSPELIITGKQLRLLTDLAQSLGVPLKSILLAAHCRVVSLLAGQPEIATALIVNGRPELAGGERLIGVFLNTSPFRITLDGGTWKDLIRKTFALEKDIIPHRRMPFSEIKRMFDGAPALDSAFDYVQFHAFQGVPGFKEGRFAEGPYFEANDYNLYATCMLAADGSELNFHCDYNPNEFAEEQIRLICDYYSNALAAIANAPDEPYDNPSLLPRTESQRLLSEWNDTATAFPQSCLHTLIEAQAASTPERIAASFGPQEISYAELNRRADVLARQLKKRGIGLDNIVGVCVERSIEMLVSVLAVLKSGGAYLPLDPTYPSERITFMLNDSEAKVVVTQQKLSQRFSSEAREIVCVDNLPVSDDETLSRRNGFRPGPTPENLAYLIYTSGSTGKPKGVEIPHSAVVNCLTSLQAKPGLSQDDRWLAVTTLSFDISVLELFLPLISGACVVIAPSEIIPDSSALAAAIEENEISVMQATPTLWRNLVESGWQGNSGLKALCGGESLDVELTHKLADLTGELWNMYGPTETTIWSAIYRIDSHLNAVPIGRPIGNTQIYILNDKLQPVPTGTEGEIYIGGAGMARGYFKRPELTRERFIENPFQPQQRLYKTGDLGRYLPDGTLMISGRIDHQVKIQGHRIELGEIEAALQQHPDVSVAAVRVCKGTSGSQRLAGYWVPRNGVLEPNPPLRAFLEEKLPGYMVPVAFIKLNELPLTPNGKIDRMQLPEPEQTENRRTFVAPRSPLETIVADAWKQVLKQERIGVDDDFFELGGDSLRATQIIARLRKQLEVDATFACIFENRTVARFVQFLTRKPPQPKRTADHRPSDLLINR